MRVGWVGDPIPVGMGDGGNPRVQHQREARRTFCGVNFVRAGSVEVKALEGGETLLKASRFYDVK